jgi:predicted restriction endonuclease
LYYDICQQYEPNRTPSPYILPYFHLVSESFYHIDWSGVPFVPSPNAHSPSGKYIKENAKYSFLDQALWDLLQDFNVREEFRETIINFFLKSKE